MIGGWRHSSDACPDLKAEPVLGLSQDSPFDTDRVHQDMLLFNGSDSGVQAECFYAEVPNTSA